MTGLNKGIKQELYEEIITAHKIAGLQYARNRKRNRRH